MSPVFLRLGPGQFYISVDLDDEYFSLSMRRGETEGMILFAQSSTS